MFEDEIIKKIYEVVGNIIETQNQVRDMFVPELRPFIKVDVEMENDKAVFKVSFDEIKLSNYLSGYGVYYRP